MASFTIHGGSFRKGKGTFLFGILTVPKNSGGNENIPTTNLMSVEIATQEKQKKLLGMAGGGLVGLVVLGPLGAIGGMLVGGNSSKITFIATLRDNRTFLATCDTKTFSKLQAIALQNETEKDQAASRLIPSPPDDDALFRERSAEIESVFSVAKETFEASDWETTEILAPSSTASSIIYGWQGKRSVGVAISSDEANSSNIGLMANAIRDYDPDSYVVIMGSSLGADAAKTGKKLTLSVRLLDAPRKTIEEAMQVSAAYQKYYRR